MSTTIGLHGGTGTTASIQINGIDVATIDSTGIIGGVVGKAASGANADITSLSALTQVNGSSFTNRQRIMNGDMRRSTYYGASAVTPSAVSSTIYLLDRFRCYHTQASKLTYQQVADAPPGFKYSTKISVASQFSPGVSDLFNFGQTIEGQITTDFAWGSASGQSITVSFWVKGSVAGTYSASVGEATSGTRSYISTFSVTTSWTKVSFTVPPEMTGTWGTTTGAGIQLGFSLGAGSSFQATPLSWQNGNYSQSSTGSPITFVNQVAGSTLNITGVKLEPGSVATVWEPYNGIFGGEEQACQRYYQANSSGKGFIWQGTTVAGSYGARESFAVPMRVAPTMTATIDGAAGFSTGVTTAYNIDTLGFAIAPICTSAGNSQYFRGSFTATSEL